MAEYQSAPFLKQARGKEPDDRNLFEKIAVGIYGKEDPSLQLGTDLVLDEDLESIIGDLPGEVQDDVARYKSDKDATSSAVPLIAVPSPVDTPTAT